MKYARENLNHLTLLYRGSVNGGNIVTNGEGTAVGRSDLLFVDPCRDRLKLGAG